VSEIESGAATPGQAPLADHLAWLRLQACTCPWEWKHPRDYMPTWVRMHTARSCPEHGEDA
jgi:hypothetical protein